MGEAGEGSRNGVPSQARPPSWAKQEGALSRKPPFQAPPFPGTWPMPPFKWCLGRQWCLGPWWGWQGQRGDGGGVAVQQGARFGGPHLLRWAAVSPFLCSLGGVSWQQVCRLVDQHLSLSPPSFCYAGLTKGRARCSFVQSPSAL